MSEKTLLFLLIGYIIVCIGFVIGFSIYEWSWPFNWRELGKIFKTKRDK